MPGLFEVRNAAGTVLIDDHMPSIHMSAKGTLLTGNSGMASPIGTRSRLTVIGAAPWLAFKPQTPNIAAMMYGVKEVAPATWEYLFMCEGAANQAIDWWLFDALPPPSSYLEVYNTDTGQRTFSLGTKPFLPIATVFSTAQFPGVFTLDVPAGSTYAAIQGAISGRRDWQRGADGDVNRYRETSFWDSVSTRVTGAIDIGPNMLDRATSSTTTPGDPTFYGPRNFTIVDVTGL